MRKYPQNQTPASGVSPELGTADTSDGYPPDLERVLPARGVELFEEIRRWFGHSVRPLAPPMMEAA